MDLLTYIRQMQAPSEKTRRFSVLLLLIGAGLCALPLSCSVLLLGIHFWAVGLQERSYTTSAYRPHVGTMLTTSFTLLLGVLLCALVMGLGGGLWLYACAYRQAIRYQRRAFALCTRLSHFLTTAMSEQDGAGRLTGSVVEPTAWSSRASAVEAVVAALTPRDTAVLAAAPSSRALRWHREVAFLLDALAAPLDLSERADNYQAALLPPHSPLPRNVLGHQWHVRETGSLSHLRTAATATAAAAANAGAQSPAADVVQASLSATSDAPSLPSGSGRQGAGEAARPACVELSRRPRHPVDESRVRDVVTVVVCRFLPPPSLVVGSHTLSKTQLVELEKLSHDFHHRLRRAAEGCQAYTTECGVSEVVFSLNTVLPLQVLVANASAIALAAAAQKTLTDWAPQCDGLPVRWGISVHRFSAFLRPARRNGSGRLTLSFGTLEYTVARDLAQLAAVCGYGVLCHADFFADAMGDARGLPVDYVMDCMQRRFLVYQLHSAAVAEEVRRNMADALALMRGGRYTQACRFLAYWDESLDAGRSLPPAAHHLLYVARHLVNAASRSVHWGTRGVDDAQPVGAGHVSGVAEWSMGWLTKSYCRPPPVWEEEEDGTGGDVSTTVTAAAVQQWHTTSLLRSATATANAEAPVVVAASRGATPDVRRGVLSPKALASENGAAAAALARGGGADGDANASFLQRLLPRLLCELSQNVAPLSDVSQTEAAVLSPRPPPQKRVVGEGKDGSSTGGTAAMGGSATASARVASCGLRSPFSIDTSGGGGSGPLSPITSPADAVQAPLFSVPFPAFGPHLAVTPPVVALPRALQESELGAATNNHTNHTPHTQDDDDVHETVGVEASGLSPNPLSPRSGQGRGAEDKTAVAALHPRPTTRNSVTRRVRRRSSCDSRGSRSRGRSSSCLLDDDNNSAESEFTPRVVLGAAPHSLWLPDHTRSVMEEVSSYLPASALSAPSLSLYGYTPQRGASLPTKLPLFSDSAATLADADHDGAEDMNSTGSEASFAEVSHERSMTSVVQRSRSSMSARAAGIPTAPIVCTRTRCITASRDGMTHVFQGFHPSGYLVAIKQVEKVATRELQLQRNEIHLLHRLSHPNIVHIIADWEDATALYMAAEYASDTLTSVLAKFGRLLPGAVRHYVRGVLQALAYMHDTKGVVHRDVSPNNILVTNATDSSQAKLIDFGHSMLLRRSRRSLASPTAATNLTLPDTLARTGSYCLPEVTSPRGTGVVQPTYGTVVGTPMFMSPQACQGLVHPANDVWSVGIIMFLCLTGEYPYPPDTFADPETFIADVGSGRVVPALSALRDTTSSEKDFIEQCLQTDHLARPTAAALLHHAFLTV